MIALPFPLTTKRRVFMITHAPKMRDFKEDDERMHQQCNNAPTRPRLRIAATKPLQNLRFVTSRACVEKAARKQLAPTEIVL
ncbi:hypothetical protein [Bradyrhizobium vignae]|uniref:Uncharacterized protein n=1 Tax=Bradyrhizobium vignae TaxID=1549949 RepID=A0ABS4A3E8_9BRAD|nr:hypothetical protein [Bradyrhizobium vignae]MBP0114939.1 hypothetical protein [Bradyrhizobium vignae]